MASKMTTSTYVTAFVALLLLTGVTFGASFASLGPWEWAVALGAATAKSIIVALFFMHLIEMSAAHRLAGVIAIALLSTLILLAMADVWTCSSDVGPAVLG
jgi:cytochrome c oxidase subunit 4